ncbi:hypothetical protein S83_033506, partial [Arachis hypogaea]
SLDRDYFAPLSTPPLKFVFFSSLGHLLRVVFFEKEVMEAVTHIYTETYTSHLRQKIRKETKKEKKIFAEDYGLKGDPRLLAISQAIRVVSQAIRLSDMVTFGHYLKGDIPERKDFMNFDVKKVKGCQLSSKLNEQYIRTFVVINLLLGMFNDHNSTNTSFRRRIMIFRLGFK